MVKLNVFSTRLSGYLQETKALRFLQKNGYRCVDRNFSCKFGEIDLIVIKPDEILVFVEVRYRKNNAFGTPAETVSNRKQARLRKTASCFLQKHKAFATLPCRFDVIAISNPVDCSQSGIEWIKQAFY
ncbi:MAG: YraN family protein [Pseudomonadales bacterium]|nr:YraN family protein [Pseudomonadales bacterium]